MIIHRFQRKFIVKINKHEKYKFIKIKITYKSFEDRSNC